MEGILTLNDLQEMTPSIVFATGICVNSPDDIYLSDENVGKEMRWVAKRGRIHDWTIYIDWSYKTIENVEHHGSKIHTPKYIKKLVPCTDEAFNMYRF